MQSVAAEMHLSETAFLRPAGEAGRWRLRWFTLTVEVELCGHATLASAHVLFSEGLVDVGEPVRFDSASGPLGAPAATATAGLLGALGVGGAGFVGRPASTTWSSWPTRRPCATWPPTSGPWAAWPWTAWG